MHTLSGAVVEHTNWVLNFVHVYHCVIFTGCVIDYYILIFSTKLYFSLSQIMKLKAAKQGVKEEGKEGRFTHQW